VQAGFLRLQLALGQGPNKDWWFHTLEGIAIPYGLN
jgi:hypothetical protein